MSNQGVSREVTGHAWNVEYAGSSPVSLTVSMGPSFNGRTIEWHSVDTGSTPVGST
jgi:hypothetical protein